MINKFINQKKEIKNIDDFSEEKILDGVVGFVVGDALGVPAEFKPRSYLKKHPVVDMTGYGTHNMPEGTWSDDTSMVLATMDSIIQKAAIDYDDIMNKFLDWYKNSNYTATGVFFDIGGSTSMALQNYIMGINPVNCGGTKISDNGNGSLMRILPIVFYSFYKKLNEDEEVNLINNSSALTHGHEISRLGCKIYCDFLKFLLNDYSKGEALKSLAEIDYSKYYSLGAISYYKRILDGSILNSKGNDIRSSGYVVDTLEASIWCLMKQTSYEDTVLKAVNLGDDTDTVAAIAGSLAGILYGIRSIPDEWLEKIKRSDYIYDLCKGFDIVTSNDTE